MEQIRLDNQLPVKKTDHTSKGDQLKWKIGNIWYKSDYMGYDGLSETLVSHLLQKSSLSHPFVLYQPVRIAYRGTLRSGCSSPDFLKANQMLIPLENCTVRIPETVWQSHLLLFQNLRNAFVFWQTS